MTASQYSIWAPAGGPRGHRAKGHRGFWREFCGSPAPARRRLSRRVCRRTDRCRARRGTLTTTVVNDAPQRAVGRLTETAEVAANADPVPTVVVPFQDVGYRYQVVAPGGGPGDFMQPDFNDAAFSTGQAEFGSGGGCSVQGTRHTTWPTNTDILIRKTIDLPPNTTDVTITGGIDNDLFIYWNGELLGQRFHEGCPTPADFTVPVPQTGVVSGANVLAVRARDRGVESWVDLQRQRDAPPADDAGSECGAGPVGRRRNGRPARRHCLDRPVRGAPVVCVDARDAHRTASDPVIEHEPDADLPDPRRRHVRVRPRRQQRSRVVDRHGRRDGNERRPGALRPGGPCLREERRSHHDDVHRRRHPRYPPRARGLGRRFVAGHDPG